MPYEAECVSKSMILERHQLFSILCTGLWPILRAIRKPRQTLVTFCSRRGGYHRFGEMYSAIAGRTVQDLCAIEAATVMRLSGGVVLRFSETGVEFGSDAGLNHGGLVMPQCRRNIDMEPCSLDFIKSIVVGKAITSAGDFGSHLEVGLEQRFNLGLHKVGFHLISTENPIARHRL